MVTGLEQRWTRAGSSNFEVATEKTGWVYLSSTTKVQDSVTEERRHHLDIYRCSSNPALFCTLDSAFDSGNSRLDLGAILNGIRSRSPKYICPDRGTNIRRRIFLNEGFGKVEVLIKLNSILASP